MYSSGCSHNQDTVKMKSTTALNVISHSCLYLHAQKPELSLQSRVANIDRGQFQLITLGARFEYWVSVILCIVVILNTRIIFLGWGGGGYVTISQNN